MNEKPILPKFDELLKPTLQALVTLGGSGSIEEIEDTVIAALNVTQKQLDVTYPKSGNSVVPHRIAWARTALKKAGLTENPQHGVWVLTEEGKAGALKTPAELKKIVSVAYQKSSDEQAAATIVEDETQHDIGDESLAWSDALLKKMQSIPPDAFERLCQRLLRESGFTKVEVKGKSGDGGIDGVGVLRVNLISFQVLFQCKRYKGSVGSDVVRDFRGAMQGRADKGLIITTGTFTTDARKEATRDGAPAIDLIDGDALCSLMEERELGVHVKKKVIKEITVDENFFLAI
jgi:restriction system protein